MAVFDVSRRRLYFSKFMIMVLTAAALLAIVPLLVVFAFILVKGIPALNWDFFTQLPVPTGQTGGGFGNAIVGSGIMILMASMISIPLGILGAVLLSEYPMGPVSYVFRMVIDLLASLPSIVVGIFIYTVVVIPMKTFSAWAGSMALAILMLPIIARTTTEVMQLLPEHYREAGLALGLSRWRVIFFIVLQSQKGAILTGVLLALARVAGETAPLIMTAFGNRYWNQSLNQPTAAMPIQIYSYAISPFEDLHRQAWAGALTIVTLVFLLGFVARYTLARQKG